MLETDYVGDNFKTLVTDLWCWTDVDQTWLIFHGFSIVIQP